MYTKRIAMDKVGKVIIHTIKPTILKLYGEYETALVIPGETDEEDYRVVVVNACETEEDALGGHSKITDMTEEELLLLKEI